MAEILVVEDDVAMGEVIALALSHAGHKVATCASGEEALRRMGLKPDDPSVGLPDLMVLDIMMPILNGYTVATAIRNSPRTRSLPILVVSALQELSPTFMAMASVDGFLPKPFTPKDLIGEVAKILDKRKAQG